MPSRTTPESSRPRVSDRTMVANLAIATLVGFEQRMASSQIMSMKPLRRGTGCLDEDATGPRPSTARCNPAEGLDARKHPRRPASGEKYLLTFPFIGHPCQPSPDHSVSDQHLSKCDQVRAKRQVPRRRSLSVQFRVPARSTNRHRRSRTGYSTRRTAAGLRTVLSWPRSSLIADLRSWAGSQHRQANRQWSSRPD